MASLSAQFKTPKPSAATRARAVPPLFPERTTKNDVSKFDEQSQDIVTDALDADTQSEEEDGSISIDNEDVNQILVEKVNEFISEFGEQLFKLTVNQWLTKREKKIQAAVSAGTKATKTRSSSGSEQLSKKRRRS